MTIYVEKLGLLPSLVFFWVCLKMRLWNIGVEGQYVIGFLASTLVALGFPSLPCAAVGGVAASLFTEHLRQRLNSQRQQS